VLTTFKPRGLVRGNQANRLAKKIVALLDSQNDAVLEGLVELWSRKRGAHWWVLLFLTCGIMCAFVMMIKEDINVLSVIDSFKMEQQLLWDNFTP